MKLRVVVSALLLLSLQSEAKIEVLFHPQEPTLEKISEWITQAQSSIDIAMYSMDTGPSSPIMQAIKSPEVQKRIHDGQLRMRLIFEGYGSPEDKAEKMQVLENFGVDTRYLGKAAKVHHKFAVIDTNTALNRVVSGSANWSISSYRNYNENILFVENEQEIALEFQKEFDRLWLVSKDFDQHDDDFRKRNNHDNVLQLNSITDDPEIQVLFNSARFLNKKPFPPEITDHLVQIIDQAQSELLIATTRIRRTAILQALSRATARGVKIRVLINQDDYADLDKRSDPLLNNPLIKTRVKFYNLRLNDFLMYQMHNKFMIVDGKALFTGSFNWSDSAEYGHIENVIVLTGTKAAEVLPRYSSEFEKLWALGRGLYYPLLESLKKKEYKGCPVAAMTLSALQIKALLNHATQCRSFPTPKHKVRKPRA